MAINHQNIGYAHKNIGDFDLALDNYQKSLEYNMLNKDKLGKIICHNSIGDILIKQGKYNEAYKYVTEVVESAENIGNRYYLSEVYNTLGWVLIKLNRLNEAKEYLNRALTIATENSIPSSLTLSYDHLSELNQKRGNYKEALAYYKKSIELERKTFNAKNIRYVNGLISKYDNEVKNNKIEDLAKQMKLQNLSY